MNKNEHTIDFRELTSSVRGEGLEELARRLGQKLGFNPQWTGRGSDGGRDLLFTEIFTGHLSNHAMKWLVSCKDKAGSNASIKEADLPPNIIGKIDQHGADGFLLVVCFSNTCRVFESIC